MEVTSTYGEAIKGIGPKIKFFKNQADNSYAKSGGKSKEPSKKNAGGSRKGRA